MQLSMLASVYTGTDQKGTVCYFSVNRTERYALVPRSTMINNNISKTLSSASIYASRNADSNLILFGSFPPFLSPWDYTGHFLQLTNRRDSEAYYVNRFSKYGFNNLATSMLLVATNRKFEMRFSFRDLFLNRWKTTIDGELDGRARRDGDPILTWEMWPKSINHLDPDRRYLKVHQRLVIALDWWADYAASIIYHIYLYLDNAGKLQGHVARWAMWVENGPKKDDIQAKLRPAVKSGVKKLNRELANELEKASTVSFSDLYYLPGRQITSAPTGAMRDLTTSDVTIVTEL